MSADVGRAAVASPAVDPARVRTAAAVATGVGLLLMAMALLLDTRQAMVAWLTAFSFGLSLALGALALVMIGWVTGARWFVVVRRVAETVAATLPVFLLLVVPILLSLESLYPWARGSEALTPHLQEEIAKKEAWLNGGFFVARSLGYLVVWAVLSGLLWRWSVRSDGLPDRRAGHPVTLSAVGLPVYGFTVTFAAFDWLMSLQPGWHSTIFGVYWFAGGFLGALALLVLLVRGLETGGLLRDRVVEDHYYALGRLLLTFVIFWTYIAYSQGFLMWIADLPSEVEFWLARWEEGWMWATVLLIVGHFGLPFFALLSRDLKRRPTLLSAVAGWLLLMHWLDTYWLVAPTLAGVGPWPGWEQVGALLAVVGAMGLVGSWRIAGHPAMPVGDPHLEESMGYRSR